LTWRLNVFDDGMVKFIVASRVEDHDDDGVEDRGDEGSKIMATARSKIVAMKGQRS
jgi:hypothetical protein